jgi:hypothetical protein
MASARRNRSIRSGVSELARTRISASGARVATAAITRLTPLRRLISAVARS